MIQPAHYKNWTIRVLLSVALLVGFIVIINVVVDAYGIFRRDFSRQPHALIPNMNYIKMKFLMENRERFDSFIFGSSRVENIDQSKIANGRYYNMTYALGLPQEHLANVKYLLQNGVRIKNIIIGIDEFSYEVDPGPRRSSLMNQPLPAISGRKLENFYGEYFFKLKGVIPQLEAYIRHNYTHKNDPVELHMRYDMFGTGRLFCRTCDDDIEKDQATHGRHFEKPAMYFEGDYIDDTIAAIKELVDICRANDINLVLFISPSQQVTYLNTNLERFARFKKELAGVAGYFDFSGLNTITRNPYYYYEPLHYRPIVGDMMLRVMFGKPEIAVPADFGMYVTASNVDAHLRQQCLDVQKIRDMVSLTDINAAYSRSCAETVAVSFYTSRGH
jgi:hypothetical protein